MIQKASNCTFIIAWDDKYRPIYYIFRITFFYFSFDWLPQVDNSQNATVEILWEHKLSVLKEAFIFFLSFEPHPEVWAWKAHIKRIFGKHWYFDAVTNGENGYLDLANEHKNSRISCKIEFFSHSFVHSFVYSVGVLR